MKILLIDNNRSNLDVLSSLLNSDGHECAVYSEPIFALKVFKEKRFDIVVSYVKMPLMTGIEVLRIIKRLDDSVPVMIYGNCPESGENCLDNGADRVLMANVTPEKIVEEINGLCLQV